MNNKSKLKSGAMTFILLMGIVSLFSDMTHEGARSILGEYLNISGASAATIGFVSGLGELIGYSFRIISGYFADKTKKYWVFVIIGYTIQVAAIPALALVPENGWVIACGLITMERIGKAIKKPAKNTLVSFASDEVGIGKGFAYQEFLDQIGAFLGPVMMFIIAAIKGTSNLTSTYRVCFTVLGIPALITVSLVLYSRHRYPNPDIFKKESEDIQKFEFKSVFALYMTAIVLFSFGFADFTMITLHASKTGAFPKSTLSLLYALAMAIDAFAALFFGWLFDRIGIKVVMISTLISSLFSAFIFLNNSAALIIVGIILWGIGMGAQESVMKASVAKIVPRSNRSMGFGIFETGFGISWFIGSWLIGILYDVNPGYLVILSVTSELLSVIAYMICISKIRSESVN